MIYFPYPVILHLTFNVKHKFCGNIILADFSWGFSTVCKNYNIYISFIFYSCISLQFRKHHKFPKFNSITVLFIIYVCFCYCNLKARAKIIIWASWEGRNFWLSLLINSFSFILWQPRRKNIIFHKIVYTSFLFDWKKSKWY